MAFADTSSGPVSSRRWDFGDGGTSRGRSPEHVWSAPGFYTVSLTVGSQGDSDTESRKLLVESAAPAGTCVSDAETLCLQDSRFEVALEWWTADDQRGVGRVVHEGTNDSGLFWFFGAANWEMLVKVLDGCSVNGHAWVYGASATTLGYSLMVTDTVAGGVKEYRNEPGEQAAAFTTARRSRAPAPAALRSPHRLRPTRATRPALRPGARRQPRAVRRRPRLRRHGRRRHTSWTPPPCDEAAPTRRAGPAAAPKTVSAPSETGGCTETATAMCCRAAATK